MHLPDAAHHHARRCRAGFDTQLGKNTLQVFFDGHRAAAQNVANVAVDLPLDHPVQHLGHDCDDRQVEGNGVQKVG